MRFRQQLPALGIGLGRLPSVLLIVAVLTTLFAPALIQLAGRQADTNLLDNRPPARMPALPSSLSLGALEQFRNGLTNFIDDNFGLRVEMVKLNIRARSAIGVSAIPTMFTGKEGWLFLKTDNEVLDQVRALNRFADADLDAWIDLMELQQRWVKTEGADLIIVIAPNPHTIYPEYLPSYVNRVWPETRLDQIMRRIEERGSRLVVVDPRRDLWAAKGQALLYHKYEDHWNSLGAFVAYSAAMRAMKNLVPAVQPRQLSDYAITQGSRVWNIPPREEADPVFTLETPTRIASSRTLDNKISLRPIVETTTTLDTAPSALVHGDSFSDVMMPFFNETFRRTIFVPTAHAFPAELIQQHKPDVVILGMVERSLSLRPPASDALENEDLARHAPSLDDAIARASGIGGYINAASEAEGRLEFSGWALDRAANAPARLALAYYDTRPVGAARMWYSRPDIASSMNDKKIGFRLSIPSDPGLNDPSRLRFFSTNAGGRIYEIALTPALRRHLEETLAPRTARERGTLK